MEKIREIGTKLLSWQNPDTTLEVKLLWFEGEIRKLVEIYKEHERAKLMSKITKVFAEDS